MKRKIITAAIAILLPLAAGYYISLPDYEVVNSMSFSSQNTRDTEIKVAVYKLIDVDGTVRHIEEEHNKVNGVPTSLEINMYRSRWFLRHGIGPFKTVRYEYQ